MAELLNTAITASGSSSDVSILKVNKKEDIYNNSTILDIKEDGNIIITTMVGTKIEINSSGIINIGNKTKNFLSISGGGIVTINNELSINEDAKISGIFSGSPITQGSTSSSTTNDITTQTLTFPKIEIANGKAKFSTNTIELPKYAGSDSAGGAAEKVANKLTFSNVVNKEYDGSKPVTIDYDDVGALANDTRYALRK